MLTLNLNLLWRTLAVALVIAGLIIGAGKALGQPPKDLSPEDIEAIKKDPLLKAIITSGCYANYHPKVAVVQELLYIERQAGISGEARGITVAAACNESGFSPKAMGDWADIQTGERCANNTPGCQPTSFGMLQQKNWVRKKLRQLGAKGRIPQFDWKVAAFFWAKHMASQVPRVKEECGYKDSLDLWRASHRTAVMYPKCGRWRMRNGKQVCRQWIPRCHRVGRPLQSSHWRILDRWKSEARGEAPTDVVWKDQNGKVIPRAVNPIKESRTPVNVRP